MSSDRLNFKSDLEHEPSMVHQGESTLSYTFRLDSKDSNQAIHIALLYITLSKYGTDWVSLPHSHHFTEFFYITNGTGKFSVESNIYDVKANDLIILNPNTVHTEISEPKKPMEYIVLGIEGIEFQADSSNFILLNSSTQKTELHFYFNTLAHEMKSDRPYRNFVCQNLLNIIFTIILRNNAFKISLVNAHNLTRESSIIKKYIDEHYKENITIDTLCSLVHLNKYYCIHKFKKEVGTTPIHYLTERRIEESKHLLRSTNHSLSSIAQILGFSSPSYFSQVFKKLTNQSPQDYKKSLLQ